MTTAFESGFLAGRQWSGNQTPHVPLLVDDAAEARAIRDRMIRNLRSWVQHWGGVDELSCRGAESVLGDMIASYADANLRRDSRERVDLATEIASEFQWWFGFEDFTTLNIPAQDLFAEGFVRGVLNMPKETS